MLQGQFQANFYFRGKLTSMKKVILMAAVVAAFGFTSCGGIDVDKAAEEFCACAEKEGEEKEKCHKEWVDTYKGAKGSEEDGKKLGEAMVKCDPEGALSVLSQIAE
jgi:hypothetical protein